MDVEWYLTQQILPPIARLCEPIEGTSLAVLAERLGLDKSRFAHGGSGGGAGFLGAEDGEAWGFTPACKMEDGERFAACDALRLRCTKCKVRACVWGGGGLSSVRCCCSAWPPPRHHHI